MFKSLINRIFTGPDAPPTEMGGKADPAPVPSETGVAAAPPAAAHAPVPQNEAFISREAVLDRNQQVVGYQLMLHEATRQRMTLSGRATHHAYAQVLVGTIAQSGIGEMLGRRKAFLSVPDSFLGHAELDALPAAHMVLVIERLNDTDAPPTEWLAAQIAARRAAGFRVALSVLPNESNDPLLQVVDLVAVRAGQADPTRLTALAHVLRGLPNVPRLMLRDLPSGEDFQFGVQLGAVYFQGPFVTRRENYQGRKLAASAARLAELLNRLRRDAEAKELAELVKQDAALSLRLLRYINSAAVGLPERVSSLERALLLMGRQKLYRWAVLLLYGGDAGSPRAAALLENALVRARMLELLGRDRPVAEREALYLTGLLSLTDLVLEVPMTEAMAGLSPAPEIAEALLEGKGWLADYLSLAIAAETLNPQQIALAAETCGVSAVEASTRHMEALTWAMEVSG